LRPPGKKRAPEIDESSRNKIAPLADSEAKNGFVAAVYETFGRA